jgi:predicted glutamine amidotransferase
MCVAIYKPKGIKSPSLDILKKCWDANPDGAGLAWRTSGKYPMHIEKGFMYWKDFESYWTSLNLASYDDDLFIHFRITTHGGTCPSNTHPFPIADNDALLGSCSVSTKYVMMHNGVLPIQPDNKRISDTMMLSKLIARGKFESNIKAITELLDGFIGTNKIAFMTADEVYLIGAWKDVDGVKFSNDYWNFDNNAWFNYRDTSKKHKDRVEDYSYADYDDDYYETVPTINEKISLSRGICPWCKEAQVDEFDDCYICYDCGVIYEKELSNSDDDYDEYEELT